jgi:galactose-1-phosphate uridylyltransferase
MLAVRTRVGAVLREAPVHGDAVGLKVLAEQLIAPTTIETLAAELRIVSDDTIADIEALDLGTHRCNDTDGLVA